MGPGAFVLPLVIILVVILIILRKRPKGIRTISKRRGLVVGIMSVLALWTVIQLVGHIGVQSDGSMPPPPSGGTSSSP